MKKKIELVKKMKPSTRTDVVAIRVTSKERKSLMRLAKRCEVTVSSLAYGWVQEKLAHENA